MGSLSSRPSVPAPVQTVFVPAAPAPAPTTTTQTSTENNASTADNSADATPTPSETRTQNLLQRNRGRFGTILTGLSGLLSPVETQGQRKTLLGE